MKTINVKNIQDRIFMLHLNLVTTQSSFFLTANHCYNDIYEEYREFIKITFTHWNIVRDINIFVKDISVNNYLKLLDNCILKLSQYNLYYIYFINTIGWFYYICTRAECYFPTSIVNYVNANNFYFGNLTSFSSQNCFIRTPWCAAPL